MTVKQTIQDMEQVLAWLKAGKTVQALEGGNNPRGPEWKDTKSFLFMPTAVSYRKYRAKPEKPVFYRVLYSTGEWSQRVYQSREAALGRAMYTGDRVVKFESDEEIAA